MFENPRRGRQARNFTTNVPKIVDRKSSLEQIFSENCRWAPLKCLTIVVKRCHNNCVTHEAPVSRSRCFLNPRHLNPFSTVFLLSGSVTINAIKFSFLSSSRESIQDGPGGAVTESQGKGAPPRPSNLDPRGVLLGNLGGGVPPGSQNSWPYFRPKNCNFPYPFSDLVSKKLCHHYLN